MLTDFTSREQLYEAVENKINELFGSGKRYPLDSIQIAKSLKGLYVEDWAFRSNMICGILYKGDIESTLYLNTLRSEKGRNFDCMHELMHYWFHPNEKYMCMYEDNIRQDMTREWQANEGAAQALMPRDIFISRYYQYRGDVKILSDLFYVGEQAVKYRIHNLKREIIKAKKINNYSDKNSFSEFFLNVLNGK